MRVRRASDGRIITLNQGTPLFMGGEGGIFSVPGEPGLVAKLYHKPTNLHGQKLAAMLAKPPSDPMAKSHVSIAWPIDLLCRIDRPSDVLGFIMPHVKGMRSILEFYNPKLRRRHFPLCDYRRLHFLARNFASAMRAIHERGYVIGDVNESNILANEWALVTLVDTDSFQVSDSAGKQVFRCVVGRPEFTPPELQATSSFAQLRSPEHDQFGLSVIIFQLLMQGAHPFGGVYKGYGDVPKHEQRIRDGHFPHGCRHVPYAPLPHAPPIEVLNPTIRRLFISCFEDGHSNPGARPDAQTWQTALDEAESHLVKCTRNDQHVYGQHLADCPWCQHASCNGIDPFPPKTSVPPRIQLPQGSGLQRTLPPPNALPPPTPIRASKKPVRILVVVIAAVLGIYALINLTGSNPSNSGRQAKVEVRNPEPSRPAPNPELAPLVTSATPVQRTTEMPPSGPNDGIPYLETIIAEQSLPAGDTSNGIAPAKVVNAEDLVELHKKIEHDLTEGRKAVKARLGFGSHLGTVANERMPLWERAEDLNWPEAIWIRAVCYDQGLGVPKDRETALALARRAADLGQRDAMYHIGCCYMEGTSGVERDNVEAATWFSKSAKLGDDFAMNNLGIAYLIGAGVNKNHGLAVYWFDKSARLGNRDGMSNLARRFMTGEGVLKNPKEAAKWALAAAELGDAEMMTAVGMFYDTGEGLDMSHANALSWFRKAAELGEIHAITALGLQGDDEPQTVAWLRKAADAREVEAMYMLGVRYASGEGIRQDYRESAVWFRKAADGGHLNAMFMLGQAYHLGRGVTQDETLATAWYRRAADGGLADAMYNIGISYAKGQGVPANERTAVEWYKKAARAGFQPAQVALRRRGESW